MNPGEIFPFQGRNFVVTEMHLNQSNYGEMTLQIKAVSSNLIAGQDGFSSPPEGYTPGPVEKLKLTRRKLELGKD